MRKWIGPFLFLLTLMATPLPASPREATFADWAATELRPWFERQPDQFMESKVPAASPVKLRYKTFLQPNARARVVMVHGYGERIEKYWELVWDFYQAGVDVYILDQRGFGRSTRLNPKGKDSIYVASFQDYVKDLEQFMVEVVRTGEPRPTLIFAHSMGGLVTTFLMHDRPDLMDGVILSAPMLSIDLKGVPRFMALLLAKTADTFGFASSYAFGQIGPRKPEFSEYSGTSSRARYQVYADFYSSPEEWPLSLGGASFRWLGEALKATIAIDDDAWAQAVTVPVILFQAERDTYVSPEGQESFCRRAPRCQKVQITGTRHELYREQDEPRSVYWDGILRFLDEHAPPGRNLASPPEDPWTKSGQNKP